MARRWLGPAGRQVANALRPLPDRRWVVGCSGGPDSLALAVIAQQVARRRGLDLVAVVVDHGLQERSAEQAHQVREVLVRRALPTTVVRVEPYGPGGIEAAARRARHAALHREAGPTGAVLLGHTLDDQAEQVLLGLARGSGARSLAAMRTARDGVYRPLLALRRAVTEQACAECGVRPWRDPHNADPRFARARARHRVLPVLEAELGPGIVEALGRTATQLGDDADALDASAVEVGVGARIDAGLRLDVAELRLHPAAIRRRVLRDWARERGAYDLAAVHLQALDRLITQPGGRGTVEIPGLQVCRRGRYLQDSRARPEGSVDRSRPEGLVD